MNTPVHFINRSNSKAFFLEMIGPTKNLTILSCDRQLSELSSNFTSFKIAKHPGTLTNVLAAFNEISGEVEFFDTLTSLPIAVEFLHSDMERSENVKIKSFSIIEGDWFGVLILSDGRIYKAVIDEFSLSSWTFEQVGAVENGISAAEWSPDYSMLVLITGINGRIILTRDFEPINEGPVQVEDFGSEEMISIGWGKKETQFHGTLGKAAAISVSQIKSEPVDKDSGDAKISWRNDGIYFAVSILDSPKLGRRIRVYDRTGNLLSTSEPIEGLEESLAWRPNGSVLASTQFLKSQNKRQVVFFERNGLRHGEFVLPSANLRVKDLSWSADSNILAVIYESVEVELWSSSNYHWYLKSKLPSGPSKCVYWDPEKLNLSIVNDSDLNKFKLVWDQIVCDSCIAIIDGASINLTPLAICNIPPPMGLCQLKLSNVPDSIALKSIDGKLLLAVSLAGSLEIYSVSLSVKSSTCNFELLKKFEYFDFSVRLIQLESFRDGFIGSNLFGYEISIFNLNQDNLILIKLPERCSRILPNCGHVLLADGVIQKICDSALDLVSVLEGDEINCEWIEILEKENVFLTMNEKGLLWGNGNLIMTQATSFTCIDQFVLITTHTHQLIFLPRNGSIDNWESLAKLALEGQNGNEEIQRRVERGALLVCAIPETSGVVLQMPRGNLETINPRAMVLASLRQYLNTLEYRVAYALCRRHRIDLNILYDHEPELFLQTIGKFVKDIDSVDHLNIFLSSLRDEDVTKSKYAGFSKKSQDSMVIESKINSVSEAILKVLKEDSLNWIDSIMTVYVVQQPPRLEEALSCIIELAESGKPADFIEKSMKYLLFLVPAEKLFEVALGMYQLPLALSIGRRSQKDPKDFEPFLEELAALDELERNFRINDHLQRYPDALKCIHNTDDFLLYMEKYKLYKEAIEISLNSANDHKLYVKVLDMFGNYLMTVNEHLSAVCCFKRSCNWKKVIESSILSGSWIEFIDASRKLESDYITEVKIDAMISSLKLQGRQKEAIQFCKLSHLVSDEKITQLAIDFGLFSDASLFTSPSQNEKFLLALNQNGEKLLSSLKELTDDFNSKVQRILRIQKAFLVSGLPNSSNNANISSVPGSSESISDNVSEMSFRTSNTTIKTRTTNSSRRSNTSSKKTERNRTRDRPGSPHEREFLLFNIRDLIMKIHRLSSEIKETLKSLVEFNDERDSALNLPRSIHSSYKRLCESVLKFIEDFRKLEVPKISYFNGNGQAVNEQGCLIENPLIDPLYAKFELPADFSTDNWSIKLF